MASLPSKVMIVDHDQATINQFEKFFASKGIKMLSTKTWSDAMYVFNQHKFDMVIVELELEEMSGLTLIQKWRNHEIESKRDVAFVVCSGHKRSQEDEALISELENIGILTKPLNFHILIKTIADMFAQAQSFIQLKELENKFIRPLLAREKYDKVLDIANKKLIPLGDTGKYRTALLFEEMERNEEALTQLEELRDAHPQDMKYCNEIGRINLKLGNLDEAQKSYELANKLAPRNLDRLNEMAGLYLRMQLPDKSIETYREIINLNPDDPDIKFEIYNRIYDAGFHEHAQNFCKQTSKVLDLIRHFNNLGVMHSKKSEYDLAIEEYEKARRLIPRSKELYRILYNMAIAHINLKSAEHIEIADDLLEQSIKQKPDFEKAIKKKELTENYLKKIGKKSKNKDENAA